MKNTITIISLLIVFIAFAGCAGSPAHHTVKYHSMKGGMKKVNKKLLLLDIGMSKAKVLDILGEPEQNEAYPWGTVWLYRTAMTSGVYGTADSDFTPVVFDQSGELSGWGRNYFRQRAQQYDIRVR